MLRVTLCRAQRLTQHSLVQSTFLRRFAQVPQVRVNSLLARLHTADKSPFLPAQARLFCAPTEGAEISITQRCAERVKWLNRQRADDSPARCLRISVEPGGCSGFQYNFSILDLNELEEDDRVFESHGAKVVVDECSLTLLRGATVDFEDDMMRTAFVISKNPVADSACGCGSSFQAKL